MPNTSDKKYKSWFKLPNILLLIGGLLITSGLMSVTYTMSKVKKFPINIATYTIANSAYDPSVSKDKEFPAQMLDRCSVVSGDSETYRMLYTKMRGQRYLRSEKPAGGDYLTLRSGMTLFADEGKDPVTGKIEKYTAGKGKLACNDALTLSYVDTTTLDRKTAEPIKNGTKLADNQIAVQEVSNTYNVDPLPLTERVGFSYQFPFSMKKDKTYPMYDALSRQTGDIHFVDEKKIGGYTTYHYHIAVPAVDLSGIMDGAGSPDLGSIIQKPAAWWRIHHPKIAEGDMVEMHRYLYQEKDMWIEPRSGKVVDAKELFYQYYAVPPFKATPETMDSKRAKQARFLKDYKLTAFRAKLEFTQASIDEQLRAMKNGLQELDLLQKKLPWSMLGLGALSAIAGAVLTLRGGGSKK